MWLMQIMRFYLQETNLGVTAKAIPVDANRTRYTLRDKAIVNVCALGYVTIVRAYSYNNFFI